MAHKTMPALRDALEKYPRALFLPLLELYAGGLVDRIAQDSSSPVSLTVALQGAIDKRLPGQYNVRLSREELNTSHRMAKKVTSMKSAFPENKRRKKRSVFQTLRANTKILTPTLNNKALQMAGKDRRKARGYIGPRQYRRHAGEEVPRRPLALHTGQRIPVPQGRVLQQRGRLVHADILPEGE
jgi:hypothetical protein